MPEQTYRGAWGAITVVAPSGLWLSALEERFAPFFNTDGGSGVGRIEYRSVERVAQKQSLLTMRQAAARVSTRGPIVGSTLYRLGRASDGVQTLYLRCTGHGYSLRVDFSKRHVLIEGPSESRKQDRVLFWAFQQLYRAHAILGQQALALEMCAVGIGKKGYLLLTDDRARVPRFLAMKLAQHPDATVAALEAGLVGMDGTQLSASAQPVTLRIDERMRSESLFKQRAYGKVAADTLQLLQYDDAGSAERKLRSRRARVKTSTAAQLFHLKVNAKIDLAGVVVVTSASGTQTSPMRRVDAEALLRKEAHLPEDSLDHRGDFLGFGLPAAQQANLAKHQAKLLALPWCSISITSGDEVIALSAKLQKGLGPLK